MRHSVASVLLLLFVLAVSISAEVVNGDLKPRSFFFKRIHAHVDKPHISVSTSYNTNIYGLTAGEFAKYKTRTPYTTIPELTQLNSKSLSASVPATYSEIVVVLENRDYKSALQFTISIEKSNSAEPQLSEFAPAPAEQNEPHDQEQTEQLTPNDLATSINSPYLPHLTKAHMHQIALCAFTSRFHFPMCHHVVSNTLSSEGYDTIPQAAFIHDSTSYARGADDDDDVAATLSADGSSGNATKPLSTTNTTVAAAGARVPIVVNVSSNDSTIFIVLLCLVAAVWATLIVIIVKIGRDDHYKDVNSRGYATVSSVN